MWETQVQHPSISSKVYKLTSPISSQYDVFLRFLLFIFVYPIILECEDAQGILGSGYKPQVSKAAFLQVFEKARMGVKNCCHMSPFLCVFSDFSPPRETPSSVSYIVRVSFTCSLSLALCLIHFFLQFPRLNARDGECPI